MSKKAINSLQKQCPYIKMVMEKVGKISGFEQMSGDVYFDLLRSIAFQQLHASAATKIFGRFLDLFEEGFPYPQAVLDLDMSTLRAVGFSNQKSNYIQNIAQFALDEHLTKVNWSSKSDEEIIKYLSQIKGVGEWTVQMVLMGSLQRPDVLPLGDFGIQQAMIKLFDLGDLKKAALKKKMLEHAEPWRPYRTVACRYLWKWWDQNKG